MANNNTPFKIRGFSYSDAKIEFNGVDLPGVTAFDLPEVNTKNNNYGLGVNPVSRSSGIKEYNGSMDMDFDTQKLLRGFSPTGKMTDIPPGVLVLSLEAVDGSKEIVTYPFFQFNATGISGSQGDENLVQSIDVIYGGYVQSSF